MTSDRVEVTFLLKKCSVDDLGTKSIASIVEQSESSAALYKSHSTRTFVRNSFAYLATELRYKSTLKPVFTQEKLTALLQGDLENEPEHIGKPFPGNKDTPLIVYTFIDPEKLSENPIRLPQAFCVLKIDRELMLFKDVENPMVATLFGTDSFGQHLEAPPSRQLCNTENGVYDVDLRIGFFQLGSAHQKHHQVVRPGMKIPEFLAIELHARVPKMQSYPPVFTLTEWRVLFHELRCFCVPSDGIRTASFTEKLFRTKVLHENKIPFKFRWELYLLEKEFSCLSFDRCLLQCQIPDVGPTYFSNHLTRCYALSFTVKFECEGVLKQVTSILEVNVAEEPQYPAAYWLVYPMPKSSFLVDLVRLQRSQRSTFVPLTENDTEIREINRHGLLLSSYDTVSFAEGNEISTMTVFVARVPDSVKLMFTKELESFAEEQGLKSIGDDLCNPDSKGLVLRQPHKHGSDVNESFQQFESALSGHRFRYCLPMLNRFIPRIIPTYHLHCLTCGPRKDIYIDVEFKDYHRARLYSGCIVVDPGSALPDIFNIQIVSKKSFEDAKLFPEISLKAWKFEIKLIEHIYGDRLKNQAVITRTQELLSIDESFEMVKDVSSDILRHRTGRACVNVPSRLYDCKLPPLAPSFFSKDISRTYAFSIKVHTDSAILDEYRRFEVAKADDM